MLGTVAHAGGEVHFVELLCAVEELKRRMESPSRLQFQKLSSVSQFEQLHAAGTFEQSYMPTPLLSIDSTLCTPRQAAIQIKRSLEPGV
jgi:hypothetical protein